MHLAPEATGRSRRLVATLVLVTAATALVVVTPQEVTGTAAVFTARGTATTTITTAEACSTGDDAPYALHLADMDPAPTLWWRFGEPPGAGVVADATPAGHDGVVAGSAPATGVRLGAAGLVQCDAGGALEQLSATAGTGLVALPQARPLPGELTVAVWLQAGAGATGGLVSFGDAADGSATAAYARLGLDPGGHVTMTLATPDGPVAASTSVVDLVTDGAPHLVVATVVAEAGQRRVTLYLDGALADTATGAAPAAGTIGHWQTGGADEPGAPAVLDELAVWEGHALTPTDIAALARADHW